MTYQSTRICFIIALSIIGLLYAFFEITPWWLVLPCTIYLALIVYGSAIIQANFFSHAYCYANISEKVIALSFDDGPNREYTPQVLSILARHNASATFFVIGKNIQGNESILKQIDADGHSIGNHSYTHSFFIDFKSLQGFKNELNQTAETVFKIIGRRMKLFRPPYGVTTPNLAKAANELDYSVIGWSIRSFDTTADTAQIIIRRVETQIKPGAIILFHDASNKTIQVLNQTLSFAKENGYKIVSVERLLKIKAYE
ncbi:MAG: polysaccharide deacetylase family protein [Gammaproteobacteria bacterium]